MVTFSAARYFYKCVDGVGTACQVSQPEVKCAYSVIPAPTIRFRCGVHASLSVKENYPLQYRLCFKPLLHIAILKADLSYHADLAC